VAIAVIALTSALITPPLFLAAATRLQNQRAEQAMQIAQGEIDRIRFLVERNQHKFSKLPAISTNLTATPAPDGLVENFLKSSNGGCPTPYNDEQYPVNLALPVDLDGDCESDFMVQIFRTAGTPPGLVAADDRPNTFCLMVRVYARPAIDNLLETGGEPLIKDPASLQFTTGSGNQATQPLAVLTTPIFWSDQSFSSNQIWNALGASSGNNICT
jgi:type II secretory pathway pseudopilin PulG